jgi:hypothetical protein
VRTLEEVRRDKARQNILALGHIWGTPGDDTVRSDKAARFVID